MFKHSAKYLTAICSVSGILYATTAYSGIGDLSKVIKSGWYWLFAVNNTFQRSLPHLVHVTRNPVKTETTFSFYEIPADIPDSRLSLRDLTLAGWRQTYESKLVIKSDEGNSYIHAYSPDRCSPVKPFHPSYIGRLEHARMEKPRKITWRPVSGSQCRSIIDSGNTDEFRIIEPEHMEHSELQMLILDYVDSISERMPFSQDTATSPDSEKYLEDVTHIDFRKPGTLFSSTSLDIHAITGRGVDLNIFVFVPHNYMADSLYEEEELKRRSANDPAFWDRIGLGGQSNFFPVPENSPIESENWPNWSAIDGEALRKARPVPMPVITDNALDAIRNNADPGSITPRTWPRWSLWRSKRENL